MGRLKDWWMEQMELNDGYIEQEWPEDKLDPILIADAYMLQVTRQEHLHMKNSRELEREYRYERRKDGFMLRMWHNGRERLDRGEVSSAPAWLAKILDVARLANQIKKVNEPPPDEILWFCTDLNNNLLHFMELE